MFHAQVQHDFDGLKKEEAVYKSLPKEQAIRDVFIRIKWETKAIVEDEMERVVNTPG